MIDMDAPVTGAFFDALEPQPADALLALIGMHARDPRSHKLDLGVGVFRDDGGKTPIMRAVKAAEGQLHASQPTKAYLGAEGDVRFVELLAPIAFGDALSKSPGLHGLQTPGGTGALRLAAELVARANPAAQVWFGFPTWPNHAPIFAEAGLQTVTHSFFDVSRGAIDFDVMMAELHSVAPGDIVVLHGCCHNPTGADFSATQWAEIGTLLGRRGAVPLIDLAYQGLGDGLDPDVAGMRHVVASLPDALIAYSCDKNFGLYRERVGALWIKSDSASRAAIAFDNLLALSRSLWSMPPDHGAAVVRTILDDGKLRRSWSDELDTIRSRLNHLRRQLAASHFQLAPLREQRGMFAMLPIGPAEIAMLREKCGIYMAGSGRINLAGLNDATIPVLTAALAPLLDKQPTMAEQT